MINKFIINKDFYKIETHALEKNKLNNNYYITNFQDNK